MPKILKLVVLVHLLYLDIGEGLGVENFTTEIKFHSLYGTSYEISFGPSQPEI